MRRPSCRLRTALLLGILTTLVWMGSPESAQAQERGGDLIEVGQMSPNIVLTGATRYGVLKDKIELEHFRGETVVLAFFFRVRTRG